jgi:DNA modification methylase
LKILWKAIGDLAPYPSNSRTHSEAQIAQIAASITEFGFTNPVLADADGIVAGHARVRAAEQLIAAGQKLVGAGGLAIPAGKIPVIDCSGWSAEQRRAYVIADNRLAENAGWDRDLLRLELAGFDLALTGFDDEALADLLATRTEGLTDPDDAPALGDRPAARPGDIWLLGAHRLACGDCTDPETVTSALGGAVPLLMVTDPPYGVEYDPNWRNEADRANGKPYGARAIGKVVNDARADWREAWALFPGDVGYIWHAGTRARSAIEGVEAAGFEIRAQIIWAKNNIVIGRGNYHHQHEPCLYAVRAGKRAGWHGGRKQSTLWQIDKPLKSETGHSTQKPVECMRRPIENNSSAGQAIYDPFMGSGTTIIAAETSGRMAIGIEIDPLYVDVCVRRWEAFTGKAATLESDGRIFAAVAAESEDEAA